MEGFWRTFSVSSQYHPQVSGQDEWLNKAVTPTCTAFRANQTGTSTSCGLNTPITESLHSSLHLTTFQCELDYQPPHYPLSPPASQQSAADFSRAVDGQCAAPDNDSSPSMDLPSLSLTVTHA